MKILYVKIVDELILFFFKVSLSIFSLEALNISWVWGVFIMKWEWNVKSQVFQNRVGLQLGLATWLSCKFKPRANRITILNFLSCSAPAGMTVHLLCMLHLRASSSGLPAASHSRVPVTSSSFFAQSWAFLYTLSYTTLTWFPPKYRVTNC